MSVRFLPVADLSALHVQGLSSYAVTNVSFSFPRVRLLLTFSGSTTSAVSLVVQIQQFVSMSISSVVNHSLVYASLSTGRRRNA